MKSFFDRLFFRYRAFASSQTLVHNWRLLSVKKILYLPHVSSTRERLTFVFLFSIALISGFLLVTGIYVRVTKEVPAVGGTYTEGLLSEPRYINPLYASTDGDRDLARLVFSSLFFYAGDGSLKPDLAESYAISPDGKTYTVTVRQKVFWHDGKPLTADDILFTIKTIQNPHYKSPLRANWQGVTVKKIDAATIQFILRNPYAPFIENMAVGILPEHVWNSIDPEKAPLQEVNLKPVGSGPYRFGASTLAKDGSILRYELVRNAHYYREGPYVKKIVFLFFGSESELLAAWQRNTINGFGPFPAGRMKEIDRERASVAALAMPRVFGIFFNQKRNALLTEKPIREAIAYALNKKDIASVVAGGAIVTDVPLPLTPQENNDTTPPYPYNLEKSRALLDTDGWKNKDSNGIRKKDMRIKGRIESVPLQFILATSDWPDLLATAEKIKNALSLAGIDIIIESKNFTDLETSVIRPRNFDLLLFGEVYGFEPDPFPFWHSSQIKDPGLNVALYANKQVDQLLQDARRSPSIEIREKKYRAFQNIVATDLPALFLYSQLYYYLLPASMRGTALAKISLPADRFNEINTWYISTRRVFR